MLAEIEDRIDRREEMTRQLLLKSAFALELPKPPRFLELHAAHRTGQPG